MPLEILPLTPENIPEAAHLSISSFENNPFRIMFLPNGDGPASVQKLKTSITKSLSNPSTHCVQIRDTTTDIMAAYAIWEVTNPRSPADWAQGLEERLRAFPEARQDILAPFFRDEQKNKKMVMGDKRWWELSALNVLPGYQRQGMGSRLMRWGLEKEEAKRWPNVMVSTEQGYGLYVKHGFKEAVRWDVDLKTWGGEMSYFNAILTRNVEAEGDGRRV